LITMLGNDQKNCTIVFTGRGGIFVEMMSLGMFLYIQVNQL
jgi:hypothetical protein